MKTDLTICLDKEMLNTLSTHGEEKLIGHWGTHFDVMDKEFPLEYCQRKGILFDLKAPFADRELEPADVPMELVEKDMFVCFYSGYTEDHVYGEDGYFKNHPQLSHALIKALLEKGVSIIGVDFPGVRRGAEHTPADQLCADHGVFIIENLCNLSSLLNGKMHCTFTAHTYPLHMQGLTGLPCRVIGECSLEE